MVSLHFTSFVVMRIIGYVVLLQLLEDLHDKQRQEAVMKEELESLNDMLRSEKQNMAEVVTDRDKMRLLCHEKDSELQVNMIKFGLNSCLYFWFLVMKLVTCRLCCWRKGAQR